MSDKHLRVNLIDPDKLVKVNDLKEITNPVFFVRNAIPTPDGLLSNEIFGITKYSRSNTFAYIDLYETFINPLIYKMWCKIDSNIKPCIHGTKYFKISEEGELVEDIDGETGIFVNHDDKELLMALSSLYENEDKRRMMGAAGRQYVIDHFNQELVWREIEKLYK